MMRGLHISAVTLAMSLALPLLLSCGPGAESGDPAPQTEQARYFSIRETSGETVVRTVSPFTGEADSVVFALPLSRVVCMSSTLVAGFVETGGEACVAGVSGKRYISSETIRSRADVMDVGYDAAFDYEGVLMLRPDLVLAYAVSPIEPPYVARLRSLGVPVLMVYDNFESHPLARASYIRLVGALSGTMAAADSIYGEVSRSYRSMAAETSGKALAKVLINAPYGDAWYVPGADSYMYRLVHDAGGHILGAKDGAESSLISMEQAYSLSLEADVWLNPGYASTTEELLSAHTLFRSFSRDRLRVWNNIRRMTPEGGNDFYERGAVRPDLALRDLCAIFQGSDAQNLEYYIEVK